MARDIDLQARLLDQSILPALPMKPATVRKSNTSPQTPRHDQSLHSELSIDFDPQRREYLMTIILRLY